MVDKHIGARVTAFVFKVVFLLMIWAMDPGLQTARAQATGDPSIVNIVFISDVHYGLTKKKFRGDKDVTSHEVNAAMVRQINTLPSLTLPGDNGVAAGKEIGAVDYLVEAGDICNRMEDHVQSAAASWSEFESDYIDGLRLNGRDGQPAKLLLVPGNHDVSNAIGYTPALEPPTDPTAMVKMYNMELNPQKPLSNKDYDYAADKVNYSRYIGGTHFEFITIWPDSAERIWMQKDLDTVAATTPVIIVTHDPPTCDAKHFTNPAYPHNRTAKFQNLVAEQYKEDSAAIDEGATDIEQAGFKRFLIAHPNIKAYFHGHNNWNEFYRYPYNEVAGTGKKEGLYVFRVDSPMKGKESKKDEKLLSFQLISIDPELQRLTVRECLWNTEPTNKKQKIKFAESETISLKIN